ncbi:MAG TPA: hypothetical protein VGP85_15615 [Pyrinomonadaceae bacterium]|nr:hypothetical protein [Pyrinomonadaceae bacterium]
MSAVPVATDQAKVLFEQYKLAVEMAAGISAKRQSANTFFIGLVSGFGVVHSLLEKTSQSLLILPICLCVVWWFSIYSYRRINKAKWKVIYELEKNFPAAPFTSEGEELGSKAFMLTKLELAIPIVVGLVFLLFALRAFLKWVPS